MTTHKQTESPPGGVEATEHARRTSTPSLRTLYPLADGTARLLASEEFTDLCAQFAQLPGISHIFTQRHHGSSAERALKSPLRQAHGGNAVMQKTRNEFAARLPAALRVHYEALRKGVWRLEGSGPYEFTNFGILYSSFMQGETEGALIGTTADKRHVLLGTWDRKGISVGALISKLN